MEDGADYATISRRLTSYRHKMVEQFGRHRHSGDLDWRKTSLHEHQRLGVTLQPIRRRMITDQDQATPLTSQRLLKAPDGDSTPPPSR